MRTDELTRLRADAVSWLPGVMTVRETNTSYPCRVSDAKRDTRIPHTPYFLRIREFKIKTLHDAVVDPGNHLDVSLNPEDPATITYVVIEKLGPYSDAPLLDLFCAKTAATAAGGNLPVEPNETVVFEYPGRPRLGPLSADVYLFTPTIEDVQQYGLEIGIKYGVMFDPDLAWTRDGLGNPVNPPVLVPDIADIRSPKALGVQEDGVTVNKVSLSAVIREFGILPVATAFFTRKSG